MKNKSKLLKLIAVVMALCLVGGVAVSLPATGTAELKTAMAAPATDDGVLTLAAANTSKEMSAADIYEQNVGSTVGISTSGTMNYFGYRTRFAATGSGFIVTSDGYILTNYHVVEDSSSITVTTYDGQDYSAVLIGYDDDNDVAIIKIDAEGLTPVTIGDSDDLRVGEEVYAIGNPLGELTFSMTRGIISALNREVTLSMGTMNLIQTDCSINSGNSGGALFNSKGEVIGITNAKYSSSSSSSEASIDNICFAIPINSVESIVENIINVGTVEKPYIGVTVYTADEDTLSVTGLTGGAVIQFVTEGGPAEDAGVQAGDIVYEANGTEVTSSQDLVDIVSACQPGDKLVLSVYRDGQKGQISIKVGSKTASAIEGSEDVSEDAQSSQDVEGFSQAPSENGGSNGFSPFGGRDGRNDQNGQNGFGSGSDEYDFSSGDDSFSDENEDSDWGSDWGSVGDAMQEFFNYYFR